MFRLLRLQLTLLPMLWSLWQDGDSTPSDDAPAPTGDDPPADGERTYSQEQFRRSLARELKAATDKARADIRAELEAELARERQAEQGQFKPLYEQAEAERVALRQRIESEIPALTERAERAEAAVAAIAKREMADAPDYVVDLLAERDPVAQLEWLAANRDKFAKAQPRGASETPRPSHSGPLTRDDIKRKYLKQAGVAQ